MKKELCVKLVILQGLYRDARSTEYKIMKFIVLLVFHGQCKNCQCGTVNENMIAPFHILP